MKVDNIVLRNYNALARATCSFWRYKEGCEMAVASSNTDQLITVLRDTVVGLVRRDGVDLSSRQLGVFLTCYLRDGGHTVRGLAAELNVSKPAITRALDRLGELDLARRKVDPLDRRSVLVQRTPKGSAFLRDVHKIIGESVNPKKSSKRVAS
jgi:DNA-binding MarR family transcriptional regulator